MQDKVQSIKAEISAATANSQEELEAYRMRFISKKSVVGELFAGMKDVAPEERKSYGQVINEVKDLAEAKFKELIDQLNQQSTGAHADHIDLTLPPVSGSLGSVHPLTAVRQRIIEIFERIEFNLSEGARMRMTGTISPH